MKTKETKRYYTKGITEMRARNIAMYDDRVKAQAFDATWPILISYHGVPTYFLTLKNDVLVHKYIFINVDNGTLVAMVNDIQKAKMEYDSLLSNKGIAEKEDYEKEGIVMAIRDAGQTLEFMIDTVPNEFFVVDVSLNLDARFLQKGDKISITYQQYVSDQYAYNYVKVMKKIE